MAPCHGCFTTRKEVSVVGPERRRRDLPVDDVVPHYFAPGSRVTVGACVCLLALGALLFAVGCSKQAPPAKAPPKKGVVGRVLEVKGEVTYSEPGDPQRRPLAPGASLRAEWTVHTGQGARIVALLNNGHRWTLGEGLDRKVSDVKALALAPVMASVTERLSDLGARPDQDRTTPAGLHQERRAAGSGHPSTAGAVEPPEEPARPSPRAGDVDRSKDAEKRSTPRPRPRVSTPGTMRPHLHEMKPTRGDISGSLGKLSGGAGGAGGLRPMRHRKAATVRVDVVSARGKLSGQVIRRVVRQRLGWLRYCYLSTAIRENAQASGRVRVNLVISAAGRVVSAKVAASTLNHRATEQCLLVAFRRMVFPKMAGVTQARCPIIFSPR